MGTYFVLGLDRSLCLGACSAILVGVAGAVTSSQAVAFRIAAVGLAFRRRSSVPGMKLLMEAYDKQVLRQVGTLYQFRHAELHVNGQQDLRVGGRLGSRTADSRNPGGRTEVLLKATRLGSVGSTSFSIPVVGAVVNVGGP
jgi:hypothetical protein